MMSVAILRDLAQAVRSGNLFSNRGTSALDASEQDRASTRSNPPALKRSASVMEMPLRRDAMHASQPVTDYDEPLEPDFGARLRRGGGVRISFHGGLVPKTLWGRIAAGASLLLLAAAAVAGGLWVRGFLLHDSHFLLPGPDSIQIAGNSHLTRAQLLSIFGEDVDRNIFEIPLQERRTELESLPWIAHATVMRLLPNRVRVAVVERTPVAFVRQGSQIGLVDANGVLFDLPSADMEEGAAGHAPAIPHYSFPVLTGITASDPLSTRAARMKIYIDFVAALNASGADVSHRLSEVDLSSPEDIKAIIPDAPGSPTAGPDILVHFGDSKFLERYQEYEQHLPEWRTQYPKLASVDMRYDRQVVLDMQPGTNVALGDAAPAPVPSGATTQSKPAPPPRSIKASVKKSSAARKKSVTPKTKLKGKPPSAAFQGAPR
jgi:cell division protein FtsQ